MQWNLRMVAAQRGIWRASDLRRLLAEAGLEISTGRMSHLWSGRPISVRLDDLEVICAVLDCDRGELLLREATADTAAPPRPAAAAAPIRPAPRRGPCRRYEQQRIGTRHRLCHLREHRPGPSQVGTVPALLRPCQPHAQDLCWLQPGPSASGGRAVRPLLPTVAHPPTALHRLRRDPPGLLR